MWVCPYCTRDHSNWSGFDTEVDDVVPLAHKPLNQPTKGDQDQIEDEVKTRVAEIRVSIGEVGTRLRWEGHKEFKTVQQVGGIRLVGNGEQEMNDEQRIDPELSWVVRWRETGEEPTEGDVFMGDPQSKYYWLNRKVFVLEEGILWRKGKEGKPARMVIPKKMREQIITLCHDPH